MSPSASGRWATPRSSSCSTTVPGHQGEADFYEADFDFPWGRQTAQILVLRSEFSAGAFHQAFLSQTQSAMFEAIEDGCRFFGGVFERIRFDNLPLAVAQILKGGRRVEQDRFIAFRSHLMFESSFTKSGIEGAHEKGGVEGEVGRFRRRRLTPVPKVDSWEQATTTSRPAASTIWTVGPRATARPWARRWRSRSISCGRFPPSASRLPSSTR